MCQCRDPGRVGTGTCASPKLHPTEKSQVLTVRSRPIHQPAARMESYETKGRRHFGEARLPYSSADDYALVARFHDATTDSWVVVLAGVGRNGTEAAAQFATSPHYMQIGRA